MKLIDTHCHINLDNYKNDFKEMIDRTKNNLELIINIGYDLHVGVRYSF